MRSRNFLRSRSDRPGVLLRNPDQVNVRRNGSWKIRTTWQNKEQASRGVVVNRQFVVGIDSRGCGAWSIAASAVCRVVVVANISNM